MPFGADVSNHLLAQPGRNAWEELVRRLIRSRRRVPSIAAMRAHGVVVGEGVSFERECYVDPSGGVTIGDDVAFSFAVVILTHDAGTEHDLGVSQYGPVTIGSRVMLGARAIIMPGVTIGDDCLIGAGSVVTKDIPNDTVAAGVPAKAIRAKSDYVASHRPGPAPRISPDQLDPARGPGST